MRFFQKKFTISYATIVFSLIFVILAFVSASFIGDQVFWGYFMSGNTVSAMFLNPPPPEPYRWPLSATYGLLANHRPSEPWEEIIVNAAGGLGGLAVAFFFGLILSVMQFVMRWFLYGKMGDIWPMGREVILRYVRKTVFWSTVFTFGAGLIYRFRFTSDMAAVDTTTVALLLFVILVIVVLSRQHALNKQVSMHWQLAEEVKNVRS